jgi:N-acetylated-alpha-linked acidic dipeptidase
VSGVASAITDPERQIPVGERLRLSRIHGAATAEARREIRERKYLSIEALGSGSDFTPFLQHLGIASLNLGYGGEGEEGVYHSIYDDFSWYTRFSDTDFVYGRSLAQTIGTALMRLADADLLPFDPTALSDTIAGYVKEVRGLAQEKRDAAEELARQIDEGVALAAADPRLPFVAPKKEEVPPYFDFSPLENASAALARAAKDYQTALSAAGSGLASDQARVARVNAALRRIEPSLTREEGLPGRPWYRHYVYAPGFYTGYSVKTLPAVREAIEQKQWESVNGRIAVTAQVLEKAAETVGEAARALKGP